MALGPVGWALGGAAAGVALVKALSDDADRAVTVVQTPPPPINAHDRVADAVLVELAMRVCATLAKFDSRLDAMQSQIDDLAKRKPRHPESGDT